MIDLSIGRRQPHKIIDIEFIFERSMPEPNSGCWLWLGAVSGAGYGSMGYKGKRYKVSRVVMELKTHNDIPDGMFVCHSCDNPHCVNPDHLWLGTPSDNVQDCISKRRHVAPLRDRHGKAKLTQKQVNHLINDKRTVREIADHYGIHRTTTQRIRRRYRAIAAQGGE